jgi:hypothetical protein
MASHPRSLRDSEKSLLCKLSGILFDFQKGFQRVTLKPGESRTAKIPLKAESLVWWNEKQV